ncbi:MAG: S41 family peptidase [Blastocatellia bacterium]
MKRLSVFVLLFVCCLPLLTSARDVRLTRYPHYHQGRIVFTWLGDLWTADDTGQNIRRLTVHKARDVYPRFSPDGQWVAFSSDRNGNHDIFVIPAAGGTARRLTFHSADDNMLGWSPDGKSVLFASQRGEDFMGRLYLVNVDDLKERNAGADMGIWAAFSPDGKKLAINRRGQTYWRKYYRGSYQTDVTVMDIAAKKFTDVTDFDGMDSWPMWGRDAHIYFVSDRDGNGLTNIWRVAENGGKAEKVTSFTSGDVRWPAISADGKTIVFEHEFGVWKLDLTSKKAAPVNFNLAAETQENMIETREFSAQADDYDLAPSGRRIALSIHGEIFTAPVEEGELRQLTDSPWRDKDPLYSPDGKWVAFISDRSGREEVYAVSADGGAEPLRLSDHDSLKFSMAWAPGSRELAFTASDNKLRKYNFDSKQTTELVSSTYGNLGAPVWAPDGKWIAYAKSDATRNSDIWLIASTGGEERRVSFDSFSETNPRFSPDGRRLFFLRSEGGGGFGADRSGTQVYVTTLERQDKDPNEPDEDAEPAEQVQGRGPGAQRNQPPREIAIDWAGLKRRTRQVTRMPFGAFNYTVAPDSRTIVFLTSEPATTRNTPVIYSIQEDGRRLTRITAGAGGGEDGGGPGRGRGGAGGFGGGISNMNITRDGRTLFFREGDGVYSVSLGAGAGAAFGRGGAAGPGDGARRRVSFIARVKVDKPAEWAEMFDDAWRTMKYRFYDARMHGRDWDAMRAKYQPLVVDVGDRQELLNIINEMIGELNASHTGAAPGGGGGGERLQTGHLGLEFENADSAGRYRVAHIYQDGPADKDWVRVSAGDYLLAIDGKPVRAGDNFWPLLNSTNRLNRRVTVTLNNKPSEDGAWTTRIEPVTSQAYNQLRYERWVAQRRDMTHKLSGGRIGYLHIQAMDQPSLRKFEKEIRENRDREALVIDQRFNGGGNIEQELLAILVQREYQIWQPRGTEATGRPFAGYFGPKIVLQNWRSASNAEMFPAGFRALGLGRTIGTPTMGAVIGTGSYSLIDGSTVRTPGVGVYLADGKRTNMENYGVKPDILIENTAEDNLAGRDRQLETAVQELMKDIQKKSVAKKE